MEPSLEIGSLVDQSLVLAREGPPETAPQLPLLIAVDEPVQITVQINSNRIFIFLKTLITTLLLQIIIMITIKLKHSRLELSNTAHRTPVLVPHMPLPHPHRPLRRPNRPTRHLRAPLLRSHSLSGHPQPHPQKRLVQLYRRLIRPHRVRADGDHQHISQTGLIGMLVTPRVISCQSAQGRVLGSLINPGSHQAEARLETQLALLVK